MARAQDKLISKLPANIAENTRESRRWFTWHARRIRRNYSLKLGDTSLVNNPLMDLQRRLPRKSDNFTGSMFMFQYSAKTKEVLPYWDKMPLIIGLNRIPNGFLGLNLHYISPTIRAKMYEALLDILDNPKDMWGPDTRFKILWKTVKGFTKYKALRPTIKRYLPGHVTSKFYQVPPVDWEKTIFLPTEQFQKKNRQFVWRDSARKAR